MFSLLLRLRLPPHPVEPDWKALGCDVSPDEVPPLIAQDDNADRDDNSDDDDAGPGTTPG
jgi:hypothetical protein